MKQIIFALAIAVQSSAAQSFPCEGSKLAITATGWSVTSPTRGSYLITVDLQGEVEPMTNAIGRIFFIDKRGVVISSTKVDGHLHINSGSWTKQTTKSNNARWGQLVGMSHTDVSLRTCIHSAKFEDGTTQAF